MEFQENLLSKSDLLFLASEVTGVTPEQIHMSYRVSVLAPFEELALPVTRVGFIISVLSDNFEPIEIRLKEKSFTVDCCWLPVIRIFFDRIIVSAATQIIYYTFESR